MSITTLLADDHGLFLRGVITLLKSENDVEVVGEIEDGRKAFRLARELRPGLHVRANGAGSR